jgi:hypothetical protein
MKARVIAILIIVAFGIVRMPLEADLEREHRAAFFHGAKLDLDMRQKLGQMGFIAALGGFRAVVADLLWIEAHTAWERTEWGRMAGLFEIVTALQPRCMLFWDIASWHMAYNAGVAALNDPTQPNELLRLKAQHEYWKIGEDFLLRGVQNNPDRALLYDRLGQLYRDKFKDPEKAFAAYEEGRTKEGALDYMNRFAAYELAKIPGREREAYERLKALYEQGEDQRKPTVLTELAKLQEKLNVPPKERVYNPDSQSPP